MPSIREGIPTLASKMALKIIQINLNHCEAAQDLLIQTVREEKVDVVIVADQYRNLDGLSWKTDAANSAAIWACGKHPIQEVMKDPEETFVRVKISGIYFYSCYMPPSMPHEDFERILDRIVEDAKNRSPVAIAGDFNAWAVEWGSKETKKRGQTLLEAFSVLDLVLLNDGEKPTFIRGEASSMIDLTFVSSNLLKGITCWKVSDTCTLSDHCAITWRVAKQRKSENRPSKKNKFTGWKASSFDTDAMRLPEWKLEQVHGRVAREADLASAALAFLDLGPIQTRGHVTREAALISVACAPEQGPKLVGEPELETRKSALVTAALKSPELEQAHGFVTHPLKQHEIVLLLHP